MLSILSTVNAVTRTPPQSPLPTPNQSNITFPNNIGNNINAVNYSYSSGTGITAYLNGTYIVNCSSSEALPADNGGILTIFNSSGYNGTRFWGSRYASGGYIGCTNNTISIALGPYPYENYYVYKPAGTYNTIDIGEWCSITLPYWIRPTSFTVRGRPYEIPGTGIYPRTPNGYLFQGSNDNSNWTTLYTQAVPAYRTPGISTSSGGSTFSVITRNSFKYFRFIILSIVGSNDPLNPQSSVSLCWFGITGDSYSSAI